MKKKISFGMVITIISVVIVLVAMSFIILMSNMLRNSTLKSVDELANHDKISIQNSLEKEWSYLEDISNRVYNYNDDIEDVKGRLTLECAGSQFYALYLLDTKGDLYSNTGLVNGMDKNDIINAISGLAEDEKKYVGAYDNWIYTDNRKEMLIYAVRLSHYKMADTEFTTIIGVSEITHIKNDMIVYSFEKNGKYRGYSSVIELDGDYLMNIKDTVSLEQRKNIFDTLSESKLNGGYTVESIKEKLLSSETFRISYTAERQARTLCFIPLDNASWYFVLDAEDEVLNEQTASLIVFSSLMVAMLVSASFILIYFVIKSRREAVEAMTSEKVRGEFLSNMSHEIRTPLNGIVGLTYLIRKNFKTAPQAQIEEWLEKSDKTAKYLLSLVSDILDLSKQQAGKMKINNEPFNILDAFNEVANMQRSAIEDKNIEFIVQSDIKHKWVNGDEMRLKQVLVNIVGNASKFTNENGKITFTISQGEIKDGKIESIITCADTGIGMTKEFLSHIWDSFSQERSNTNNGLRGTGLGMALSKNFIDAMGGEISVESQVNVGSEFKIKLTLPIESETESVYDRERDNSANILSDKLGKLLVAEDNSLNAEILSEILTAGGYEVDVAPNGKIAYDKFISSSEGEYLAILMDMQMPVMDGIESTRAIRNSYHISAKTIPIIACTANAFSDDKDRALESGMTDFIPKPIDFVVLKSKLNRIIGGG